MPRLDCKRVRGFAAEIAALAVLVIVALAAVRGHEKDDSATADEGIHLFAGAEYVENGTFWMNLEHPPLMKALAGLSLKPLRLTPPAGGRSREGTPHNDYSRFLYFNSVPAHEILRAARRPFPLVFGLLIVVVWATARTLANPGAGLLAAGLIALDPGFVAHASIVHTDVGAALTMTAALVLALAAARRNSLALWAVSGLALGVALATKFSAVLLLPLFAAIALLAFLAEGRLRTARSAAKMALGIGMAGVIALGLLAATYAVNMRAMPAGRPSACVAGFLSGRGAPPDVVDRYARLSLAVPSLGHWVAGIKGVALLSTGERENVNFFRGEISRSGFLTYFPAAFALKSTPAFLLLLAAALALGRRELATYWVGGLLLAASFYFAMSMTSSFNIGVRHLFPVYPLLAISGAVVLAGRLPVRRFAPVAAGLVLSAGVSLASAHPLELGYFNFVLGSSERGAEWFADSNVDWGQDMKRLGDYLRDTGTETKTTIVAYSGLATNYYSRSCQLLDPSRPISPGRYAISDSMQAVGPEFLEGLEGKASADQLRSLLSQLRTRGRRLGRVGASITIWELPG
ncbi:MAG TPA: glycosyltransferase family 39 protein [Thermoanaerobaculia bacterium]|nr:glycosyltransferase family 39 protein [Thermoanaerobaculia bacterium]